MGQKVEVGGTGYDLKGGRPLIGGTSYAVKKGRTLIGGTGYDINLESKVNFSVSLGENTSAAFSIEISGGQTYKFEHNHGVLSRNYELKAGQTVTLRLISHSNTVILYANYVATVWDNTPYTFTVTKDCSLTATWELDTNFAVDAEVFRLIY